jgi:hypothetical protein
MESVTTHTRINRKVRKLSVLFLIVGCFAEVEQVISFGVPIATRAMTRKRKLAEASNAKSRALSAEFFSKQSTLLFSNPSDDENAQKDNAEKQWDQEESLLVMNLSPLPDVSCEDSMSRISQYIRSFPFAAVLPVQPLQALPTDDGGIELRFLRKKTHIKSGVDGGVRFFVTVRDDGTHDCIEVLVKRNSEGQSIPKIFAEKLIVQSFAKGMAIGSDCGNDDGKEPSSIKVPTTRIESPTKDMAKIQSVFHKWM